MLLAHAITLAEARSCITALADRAQTTDASIEYERVLLQLDYIHGDDVPGISSLPTTSRDVLFTSAEAAISDLARHGMDTLSVELVLDSLRAAHHLDLR